MGQQFPMLVAAALLLGGSMSAHGQPAAQAAGLQPDAAQALDRMGAYLRTLDRFGVTSKATTEVVMTDGQKLQFSVTTTYLVAKPDRMKVDIVGNNGKQRQVFYDGRRMTLVGHPSRKYVTWAQAGSVAEVLEAADEDYGIEFPLRELFLWGSPDSSVQQPTSGYKVGTAMIDGQAVDHYAFRQPGVDYQIWLTQGDRPLPRRMVITNLEAKGHPQFESQLDWSLNPTIVAGSFRFQPPQDYTLVDFGTARLAAEGEK